MKELDAYPVLEVLSALRQVLREQNSVMLQAPPGAGKSTILPLRLMDEPWLSGKRMIILQPRRIAARAVATRMAQLLGEEPGLRVGYRIRFEGKESKATRILVVTEGILVRMLQQDPALEGTGLVVFDEFHERSIHTDLSLVLSREAFKILRPDLRLLVMSATLDEDRLSSILQMPVIRSSGRQFPVEMRYTGLDRHQPLPLQMAAAVRRALRETDGDILAFLPGAGEIRRTHELLETSAIDVRIFPLYADLPFRDQQSALVPDTIRRVVLATSIAETSLTIPGITTVVDSGFSRVPRFDPASGLTRLVTIPVTLDSANQRAGRAGRLGPGVCYRLWDEFRTASLVPARQPELLEADLAPLMLELFAWGIKDPFSVDWIDAPPRGHVQQACELLRLLKAIDEGNNITASGKEMVKLPAHPRIGHMLVTYATDVMMAALACDLAAVLEERDPLERSVGADVRLRLEALIKFRKREPFHGDRQGLERMERLSSMWRRLIRVETPLKSLPPEPVEGKLLAAAYPDRIGRQLERHGHRYKLANGRVLAIDPHDPLHVSSWLVAANADVGQGEGKMHMAAAVDPEQLAGQLETQVVLEWKQDLEQVVASRQVRLGTLILSTQHVPLTDQAGAQEIVLQQIRSNGLRWCGLSEQVEDFLSRVSALRIWDPNGDWPDLSEAVLLADLGKWLMPWLSGISGRQGLSKLDWQAVFDSMIGYQKLNRLEKLVPARITVPSGSNLRLIYHADGRPPELHVRLQEIFGWLETPRVGDGKVAVMLHLLSPAFRPVQITGDLKSFWSGTYLEVRKELRARYPKHSWPEDPYTAQAVRGTGRRRA